MASFAQTHRLRAHRLGFSLVELLVVIAIIALLIGMLLPAVQKVRDAAARAKSLNNLKQMALGAHSFESSYGCLPPSYWSEFHMPDDFNWRSKGATYFVSVLPFVEQQALYDSFSGSGDVFGIGINIAFEADPSTAQVAGQYRPIPLALFVNPSDPSVGNKGLYTRPDAGIDRERSNGAARGQRVDCRSADGRKTLGSGENRGRVEADAGGVGRIAFAVVERLEGELVAVVVGLVEPCGVSVASLPVGEPVGGGSDDEADPRVERRPARVVLVYATENLNERLAGNVVGVDAQAASVLAGKKVDQPAYAHDEGIAVDGGRGSGDHAGGSGR